MVLLPGSPYSSCGHSGEEAGGSAPPTQPAVLPLQTLPCPRNVAVLPRPWPSAVLPPRGAWGPPLCQSRFLLAVSGLGGLAREGPGGWA